VKSKVIVLILGYNDLNNLKECLDSVEDQDYSNFEVYFADNNSRDGSVEFVKKNYPKVRTFQFETNSGYTGGNNILLDKAFKNGAEFCLVMNADVVVDRKMISGLVNTYQKESRNNKVGLVQPVIMLYDKPDRINTIGNEIHYMGFGYCGNYLSKQIPKTDKRVISVSGTAMLISKNYYKDIGGFDESFFMYNEDQNYSWRGLMRDYKHFLSVRAKLWHKYSFSKNKNKLYYSEKNRLMMVLKNYNLKTLVLMIPSILVTEVFTLGYFFFKGWGGSKINAYKYVYLHLMQLYRERQNILKTKKIHDREIIKLFSYQLNFSEVDNVLIRYIVNPIYYVLYKVFILFV